MARFLALALVVFGTRSFAYSAVVGSNAARSECVRELVENTLRKTQYQRDITITSVSSHAFGRFLNQYNLTAVKSDGRTLEGWALVTFTREANALRCEYTPRNFLNAHDYRLLLTTQHSWIGYHPRYFVVQLTESGFLFEAAR